MQTLKQQLNKVLDNFLTARREIETEEEIYMDEGYQYEQADAEREDDERVDY